jgi:hypothetical protein
MVTKGRPGPELNAWRAFWWASSDSSAARVCCMVASEAYWVMTRRAGPSGPMRFDKAAMGLAIFPLRAPARVSAGKRPVSR